MNKCVVNIQGYVRLKIEGQENSILPYVSQDANGVYVVNPYGNALHIAFDLIEIL